MSLKLVDNLLSRVAEKVYVEGSPLNKIDKLTGGKLEVRAHQASVTMEGRHQARRTMDYTLPLAHRQEAAERVKELQSWVS